eukprot:scaffold46156_cov38-Phaeocystis_antarctica.AAC.1
MCWVSGCEWVRTGVWPPLRKRFEAGGMCGFSHEVVLVFRANRPSAPTSAGRCPRSWRPPLTRAGAPDVACNRRLRREARPVQGGYYVTHSAWRDVTLVY